MGWVKKSGKAAARGTAATLRWSAKTADWLKKQAEPSIDKYLALTAANAGTVYGATELIDRNEYSDPTNALIMMGTGAALTAGNYFMLGPHARNARNYVAGLNGSLDKSRVASWLKTCALAASVVFLGSELNPHFQMVRHDFFPNAMDPPLATAERPVVPEVTRERPKAYDAVGYTPRVTRYDFTGTKLAAKNSMNGRIQRTIRWQPIYRSIEIAHGMPKDTLAGMIMQESYGDPMQPNSGNDGGFGLTHIQVQ